MAKRIDPVLLFQQMSEYENKYRELGYQAIAGMDEAGRGPLAGPVVAACVILDPEKPVYGVNDSKKLSPKKRAELKKEIEEKALAIGIGIVDEKTIDEINILEATKMAMKMAFDQLKIKPDVLLIDALKIPAIPVMQEGIIKGDALSVSIASASIIAKETRDDLMRELDEKYPQYGFASHKGYGTAQHIQAIRDFGPLPVHRKTFIGKFIS
ncbi:MAG: ribonuclease HII [Firmicutes bacterium]|nr:ribonuclease HII [Bacillota bacterium]